MSVCRVEVLNDQVMAALSGQIYLNDAAKLREELMGFLRQGFRSIFISLANVDYIDGSGLGVLIALKKRALQNGGDVILVGTNPFVRDLLETTRLTKVFEIH